MKTEKHTSSRPHDSAKTHVTGGSEYVDDRPILPDEVFVEVFYSEKAFAEILSIDVADALKVQGVLAIYQASDFHHLYWGTIFQDQPLLAKDQVTYVGEAILLVVAETLAIAKKAKSKIKVKYKDLSPVLSIDEAIAKKQFIGSTRTIQRGDAETALLKSKHRLEGKLLIQGADHFYLESQVAQVIPTDWGGLEVHSSAQHPTEVSHVVAHALGLSSKDVVCIVKRMGGGFGGKESQSAPIAAYAAIAAKKLGRPARIVLNKDDDMIMTGKRNPFQIQYRVGFDDSGMIQALDAVLHSDGGAYADLSTSIMERAMLHSDNAYYIPNMKVQGTVCRTHFHPHTAFRGFGGPKGVAMIERIMEEVAAHLKKDPLDIRKLNVYQKDRNITHYGQTIENNVLPELFEKLERSSDYRKRRLEVQKWNESNSKSGVLKGLSLTAVKFGISFTTRFLNQGNALVNVFRDGSVQVSTGATEMGQGVHTRIAMLVCEVLGLNSSQVQVMPTSTEKNANTSPTAASSGTDINGAAAVKAAIKIRDRLCSVAYHCESISPDRWASKTAGLGTEKEAKMGQHSDLYRFENERIISLRNPNWSISFSELTNEAYLNRVSLSEYAHYQFDHLNFNKVTGQGRAFLYFTNGVCASEVSVDTLTGEVKVLRSDILMDLGRPINEDLDVGQISGAFVQGMGWVTTENLYYSKEGKLLSHSPSTYKIPSIQDTPRTFKIDLLNNPNNHVNVRGTKAVGEPPLLLCLSVWTAIGDAIRYGNSGRFPKLSIPATSERVLRALNPEAFLKWESKTL